MLLFTLLNAFNRFVNLYTVLLIVYALLSWFPGAYQSGLGKLLSRICEPFLNLFRRLPLQFGGIDFSVMAAVLALGLITRIINQIVFGIVY
ncbi:hypothetical protein NRIC_18520 [Enterococcus florum]|uniref:YggT family protein n=1 Tax=Enterococcus florum TaxID=2480627 RepID=A0A4P5PCF6_9ENTE|nr:YggT family protein [Enterococcus florum]GCF93961.1 hypothetical protein NRIC_18520 [Enterococcus florum]